MPELIAQHQEIIGALAVDEELPQKAGNTVNRFRIYTPALSIPRAKSP
jgi:hypothetical protein